MRLPLTWMLTIVALAGAEARPTPGPDDQRLALFTREDVVLELYAPMGGQEARVRLTNRNELTVLVQYEVESSPAKPVLYETEVGGKETLGGDGDLVVPVAGQPRPGCRIVRVDLLPISEETGYVRLAEDHQGRVTVTLYRPAAGGNRAYAVLVNAGPKAATVTWTPSGLVDGPEPTRTTEVAARGVFGREGQVTLAYKPPADPAWRGAVRVQIETVD